MIQESIKVMLDHGDCFVDVNSLLNGVTPLQHCCRGRWSVQVLEWLLDRGADPNHRSSTGQTVLHIIFKSWSTEMTPYEHREALILLLKRGADPTAVDNDGKSVSYYAYHSRTWEGSMAGDAWDSALVHCGHDLWNFRRGYPRRPNHSGWYRREDFERIWEGQEHLCPYYDWQDAFYFDADGDGDMSGGHDEKSCLLCKEIREEDEKELEEIEKMKRAWALNEGLRNFSRTARIKG